MALDQSRLLDPLAQQKLADVNDRIRSATETLYQKRSDAEATAFIGASPFERSAERTTQRNGSRPWTLTTIADDLGVENSEGARGGRSSRGVVRCGDAGLRPRRLNPRG